MATDPATIIEAPAADPAPVVDPSPAPAADPAPAAADPAPSQEPASDWRADLAGEDKELLGFFGRYASKEAVLKAFKKQADDLKRGAYLKPVNENSTDEERAAWRSALGVPDAPEGYLENLPEGLVIGDDDKPMVDAFVKQMHDAGAPKNVTEAALQAYYGLVEEQGAAEAEANDNARRAGEDALREEWGTDYRRNLNVVKNYLATLPEAVASGIMSGVGADGIRLANNPEVIKWITGLALEANPIATVVPGAGQNQASAIADELAALEAKMGDRASDYWKGPLAAKNQARYLELVEARQKLGT